ncbi:hypothetical protein ASE63_04685 [Bosea sp. Root381]|uniref:hypothetical protein n=1 Tax=Bosea sp. Root381 TaxID=1736524 RepID=UPI0006FE8148|nr:hypothetical protein [Bosea sp. Root381]KRE09820.1 hypothetical protein ASE63_04685 [Bosea sp. Root381]
MDAQRIAIAESCLAAAHDKTLAFPEIVGKLIAAGFEGYTVDYRTRTTTYFLPDGDHIVLKNTEIDGEVAAGFDPAGVAAQVQWAQANPPDYDYKTFSRNVMAHGCAGYIVSFLGRRVLYFGRTAETHVEHFPQ